MHALALLALVRLAMGAPTPVPAPESISAPILSPRGGQVVPGHYIVKVKDGLASSVVDTIVSKLNSTTPHQVYKGDGFRGFASKLSDKLLDIVSKLPEVRSMLQRSSVTLAPVKFERC
jgi:hypothetical protein